MEVLKLSRFNAPRHGLLHKTSWAPVVEHATLAKMIGRLVPGFSRRPGPRAMWGLRSLASGTRKRLRGGEERCSPTMTKRWKQSPWYPASR